MVVTFVLSKPYDGISALIKMLFFKIRNVGFYFSVVS